MQKMKRTRKVTFLDSKVLQRFYKIVAIIATVTTLSSVFLTIPESYKLYFGILFLLVLFCVYIQIWNHANKKECACLKINNTNVNVMVGDIFEQKGWKVIGVNDFFDTVADDKIIAKKTLHGIFLKKFENRISEIDLQIKGDLRLKNFIAEEQVLRPPGKSTRYELGTIFPFEDYILASFGHVETEHQVHLSAEDYVKFWMHFWKNVDKIYAGKPISIPLLGAGITRFHDKKLSKQQLLETMLWTMKVSGFQCTYRNAGVNFIIHESDKDEIDFFRFSHVIL